MFTLSAQGGASLATPDDFEDAALATNYVRTVGRRRPEGARPREDARRQDASARRRSSRCRATASPAAPSPADLETGLQLLYRGLRRARRRPRAVRRHEAAARRGGREPRPAPGQVFGEKLEQVNTSNHYTSQPLTAERIARSIAQKMLSFYRQRFSNAADFTFFMVGAFKVDEVLPLRRAVRRRVAVDGPARARSKDIGIHFPTDGSARRSRMGREPRSATCHQLLRRAVVRSRRSRERRRRRRRCSISRCATSCARILARPTPCRSAWAGPAAAAAAAATCASASARRRKTSRR